MTTLNWDDIRYLLEVSRSGSLSAAARALSVEHTTVSRRITNLERDLQIKLFDRLARGWAPTAEGRQLADRAARLESDMIALSQVARQGSSLSGIVRVSLPPLLLSEIIVPIVPAFAERHPQITLELVGETRPVDLTRGEADIALRMIPSDAAELVTRTVCHIAYDLYGTASWLDVPMEKRRYIGFARNSQTWQATQLDLATAGEGYAFRTNFIGASLRAATAGIGIAMLPDFVAARYAELLRFDGLVGPQTAPVMLVMQRDIRHAPRVRAVADFLVGSLTAHTFDEGQSGSEPK